MSAQIQSLLKDELAKRRQKNPRYSIRAFAKLLKLHSSTLTRLINGSRQATPNIADRILKQLDLDPSLKSSLLLSMHESPVPPEKFDRKYKDLSTESVSRLSSWHHFALLSLFEIKSFRPESRWMANYLGISLEETEASLKDLAKEGLLNFEKGKWKLTGTATTSHKARSKALEKIHREYIERSLLVLDDSEQFLGFSGITMAINKKKIPEALRRIQDFRRNLAEYLCGMESTEIDEVYRLNIQLFSLKK